jgi:type II secretory pathway pseudopilin PulG
MVKRRHGCQRGATYLGLLFAVALAGIALAGAGALWSLESRREKERELLFIGEEYRRAIASYYDKGPNGVKEYPQKLEDLLQDRRFPIPVHHLRRLYRDPMTNRRDWELLRVQGGISGVASRAAGKPLKVAGFAAQQDGFESAASYRSWQFTHGGSATGVLAGNQAAPTETPDR